MSVEKAIGAEYNTALEFDGYSGIEIVAGGRTGSYQFQFTYFDYSYINLTSRDEYYFQICLKPSVAISESMSFIRWKKTGVTLGGIKFTSGGVINAYTGDFANLVGTGSMVLDVGIYNVLQIRVKIADSDGIIQVRLNNTLIIDFEGDTKPGTDTELDCLQLGSFEQSSLNIYVDDIVINNTLGSRNNSWPNGVPVYVIRPNAAGNYAQWTPSAGANHECVDEMPPSTTDYVSTNAAGQKDSYNFQDCPAAVTQISAVIADYWGQAVGNPAVTQIKRLVRISGVDYEGSGITLQNMFKKHSDVMELNPADSQPWEPADINSLELGMTSLT